MWCLCHASPALFFFVRLQPENPASDQSVSDPTVGGPAWSQDLAPPTLADTALLLALAAPHSESPEGVTNPAGVVSLHLGFPLALPPGQMWSQTS